MKKQNLIIALAIIIVLAALAFGLNRSGSVNQTSQTTTEEIADLSTPTAEVSYPGREGVDALTLLRENAQIETKEFSGIGEMVTSINSKPATDKNFWALYVNGAQSQAGASQTFTKSSDILEWRFEEIK